MTAALALRLDPLGGVAGDMMVAALLDAFPEREALVNEALAALGLPQTIAWRVEAMVVGGFAGRRFLVETPSGDHHSHRSHADLRDLIASAGLREGVARRALDIYRLLAEAEAAVHGTTVEAVAFHEVGAWDSVVDVVAVAALLDSLDGARWFCGPLPMGGGSVRTDHGRVPVPAPATVRLLDGMPVHDDGVPGERVTPTGAAILRHLGCRFDGRAAGRMARTGTGLGTKTLPNTLNALRIMVLEAAETGSVAQMEVLVRAAFDLDDQTPEDVAVALDRLRATAGVVDVTSAIVQGKKGRMCIRVEVLADPGLLPGVLETCFGQTTTLGVRYHDVHRAVLPRRHSIVDTEAGPVRVKTAARPGGGVTAKAECDDVAAAGRTLADRRRIRADAEDGAGDAA